MYKVRRRSQEQSVEIRKTDSFVIAKLPISTFDYYLSIILQL